MEESEDCAKATTDKKIAALKKKGVSCLKFNGLAQTELKRCEAGKATYEPLQLHFHAPSEHQVNGKNMPLRCTSFRSPTLPPERPWLSSKRKLPLTSPEVKPTLRSREPTPFWECSSRSPTAPRSLERRKSKPANLP